MNALRIGLLALGMLVATDASAHRPPPTFLAIWSAMDPAGDPGVAHFERMSLRPPPQVGDSIRWSAWASAELEHAGAPSGSLSARLAGPIDAASILTERQERFDVEHQLALLRKGELERAFVYGVLELVCRWGYLTAAGPLLELAAAADPTDASRWQVRASAARWERDAVLGQIDAHAPDVAALLTDAPGFLCRLPALEPLDAYPDLDAHPSLVAKHLEDVQRTHHAAFSSGIGVPEWSLDASVRYGDGPQPWSADVRMSLHVPIAIPGATASAEADVDTRGVRASFRIASDTYGVEPVGADDERAWLRERAALDIRLAGTRASSASLELEWAERIGPSGPSGWNPLTGCHGLCAVPSIPPGDPSLAEAMLDVLSLGWELARIRLEHARVAAISPERVVSAIRASSPMAARDSGSTAR